MRVGQSKDEQKEIIYYSSHIHVDTVIAQSDVSSLFDDECNMIGYT